MAKKKEAVETPETAEAVKEPVAGETPKAEETPAAEKPVVVVGHAKRKPKSEGKTANGVTIRHW